MSDAYSIQQILGNRIAQTPPIGDSSNRVITSKFLTQGGLNISPAAGTTQGFAITQNGSGAVGGGFSYDSIAISDNVSGGNTVDGLSIFMGVNGTAVDAARQALQATIWLIQPTSTSNANPFYVAGTFWGQAVSGDGGGLGTEKGAIFGCNPIASLASTATHMAALVGGEVNVFAAAGASVLDKYGWSIVQESTDAVAGSRNDAALFIGNQVGAVGWKGPLIAIGDGLNAFPLQSSGSLMAVVGSGTIANGIDLSNATVTGSAFKSAAFSVNGGGQISASGLSGIGFYATQPPGLISGTTTAALNFATPSWVLNPSGDLTLTLPSPSTFSGFWFYLKLIANHVVNSASTNIIPLAGGAASSSILAATAGKWAALQADGTNWQIMMAN